VLKSKLCEDYNTQIDYRLTVHTLVTIMDIFLMLGLNFVNGWTFQGSITLETTY